MRDPYDVLGVARNARQDEIKQAYRRLAKKLHPDLNPGNKKVEQQFKEVSAAYDLLSDPAKRARFDHGEIDASGAERPAWDAFRSGAQSRRESRFRDFAFDGDLSEDDLFGSFFRMRPGRTMRMRGADVTYLADVDFVEAALGGRKRLTLSDGKTLDVTIPAGSQNGQTLRLKGQGMPGTDGAPPGDAYIELRIAPHPVFTRKDNDVHVEVPVTLPEAVLGATITVPTVEGPVSLKVPKGSNTGTVLRLRGKGLADRTTRNRGHQYVTLKVVLPERIDDELSEFLARWSERHPYDVRGREKA
jgi:DnaJ-class molecular chaperone